jgi:hypothetical protein
MRVRPRSAGLFASAVATAALSATLVVLGGRGLAPAVPVFAADGCGVDSSASPDVVRDRFVASAVLRRRTACSYGIVTPTLRQGLTLADWKRGAIPVVPFPTHALRTLSMDVFPRDDAAGRRTSLVVLAAEDLGQAAFEVTIVRRGGRWLVDYWAPAGMFGAPASS